MLIDARGTSPVRHLQALGLLDEATVCVHGIWLDDQDLTLLATSGTPVVTCPQSNLKLASGTAKVSEMLERGILVGLGTDGPASNNSLDMFREMDMLAKIQKLQSLRATDLPAGQALACATESGARLLGLEATGRITVGNRADIILIDLNAAHLTPFYNTDLLVYAAKGSDVSTVIVDGKIVVRDRRIVSFNLDETCSHVKKIAEKLYKKKPTMT